MNIQSKINKLLMALRIKGIILYINTEQFIMDDKEKNERMVTKYILYSRHPKEGDVFYSKVKMLEYLVNLYREVGASSG